MTVLGNVVAVTSIVTVVTLIQGMNSMVSTAIVSDVGADSFTIQRLPPDPQRGRRGAHTQQPAVDARRGGGDPRLQRPHRRGDGAGAARRHRLLPHRGDRRPGAGRHQRLRPVHELQRGARAADEPGGGRARPAGGGHRLGRCRRAVRPDRSAREDRPRGRAAFPGRRRQREEGLVLRQLAGFVRRHPVERLPEAVRGTAVPPDRGEATEPGRDPGRQGRRHRGAPRRPAARPRRGRQLRDVHVRHVSGPVHARRRPASSPCWSAWWRCRSSWAAS